MFGSARHRRVLEVEAALGKIDELASKGEENLDRLIDLTGRIKLKPSEVLFKGDDGRVFKTRGLVKNSRFAIALAEGPENCRVERHGHEGLEWIIVLEGRLRIIFNGSTIDVARGEACQIPAGEPHAVVTLEETEALAITIPPDEGFPDA